MFLEPRSKMTDWPTDRSLRLQGLDGTVGRQGQKQANVYHAHGLDMVRSQGEHAGSCLSSGSEVLSTEVGQKAGGTVWDEERFRSLVCAVVCRVHILRS